MDARETKALMDQIAELHGSMLLLRKGIPPLLLAPTLQLRRVDYLAAVVYELCQLSERLRYACQVEDQIEVCQLAKTMRGFLKLVQGEIRALVGLVIRRAQNLGDELLPIQIQNSDATIYF